MTAKSRVAGLLCEVMKEAYFALKASDKDTFSFIHDEMKKCFDVIDETQLNDERVA